jgi:uncharacterized protein
MDWREELDRRLCHAAEEGDVPMIEQLIDMGADPNANEESWHGTPVQRASTAGAVGAVVALLSAGARVNSASQSGRTALMAAAVTGDPAVIVTLAAADGDVHLSDNFGDTALHLALRCGHVDAARALLDVGASLRELNADGKRPADQVRCTRCTHAHAHWV